MHQRAVLHRGLELGVIEAIEFESEKQEVRRGGGDALLHVGVEFAARGIGGVASVDQPGIGREPPKKVIERLIALYCLGQPRCRSVGQRCELAFIIVLEGEAFSRTAIEIALYPRIIKPRIKIGQVPFRQRAQTGHARIFSRSTSGGASAPASSCGAGTSLGPIYPSTVAAAPGCACRVSSPDSPVRIR